MPQLTPEQQALLDRLYAEYTGPWPPPHKPRFLLAAERRAAELGISVDEVLDADVEALNPPAPQH